MADREALGRLVRETWVAWAREQADAKPSWLLPWEELAERDREVDMRIGEAVAAFVTAPPLPEAYRIRAWLLHHHWTPGTRGAAGTAWHPPHGDPVGIPHGDDDEMLVSGALARIAERSGLPLDDLKREIWKVGGGA